MSIPRGSTRVATLNVPVDFTGCTVFVTIDQNGTQVTKKSNENGIEITKHYDDNGEFDYSTVAVYLTQEDTLSLEVGQADIQVRWVNYLGQADVSSIGTITLDRVLLERVIAYGE